VQNGGILILFALIFLLQLIPMVLLMSSVTNEVLVSSEAFMFTQAVCP
jgi:hypothetical protein